jgi:hypothetical protein
MAEDEFALSFCEDSTYVLVASSPVSTPTRAMSAPGAKTRVLLTSPPISTPLTSTTTKNSVSTPTSILKPTPTLVPVPTPTLVLKPTLTPKVEDLLNEIKLVSNF